MLPSERQLVQSGPAPREPGSAAEKARENEEKDVPARQHRRRRERRLRERCAREMEERPLAHSRSTRGSVDECSENPRYAERPAETSRECLRAIARSSAPCQRVAPQWAAYCRARTPVLMLCLAGY